MRTFPLIMTEASGTSRFTHRVIIVAAIALVFLLAWEWRHVLLLVFGSVLIAVGLDAIARPIDRHTPLNRAAALAAAGLIVIGVLAGIGWIFGAQVGAQIEELTNRLPKAWEEQIRPWIAKLPGGSDILRQIEGWLSGDLSLPSAFSGAFARVGGYTMAFAGGLLDLLVVVVAAVFMAVRPSPYRKGVLLLTPRSVRPRMERAMEAAGRGLALWMGGTLLSISAMALMVTVALWLLGVPAFLALGLVAGIGQIVPLIGPIVTTVPAVMLAAAINPETALSVLVVYLVASQIESNVIYPAIMEKAVDLPAALNLFAIIAMGTLFGFLGVVLATPLVILVLIFGVEFYVRGTLGEDVPLPGARRD